MSDNDGVLLEDIDHKLSAVLEGQAAMAHVPRKLDEIDTRLKGVESDVKVIKLAVKDQGKDHRDLVKRVNERWLRRPKDNGG